MRKVCNKKGQTTSLAIIIACVIYFSGLFLFYVVLPTNGVFDGHTATGTNFTSYGASINATTQENAPSSTNLLELVFDILTFDIEGLHPLIRFVAVGVVGILLSVAITYWARGI